MYIHTLTYTEYIYAGMHRCSCTYCMTILSGLALVSSPSPKTSHQAQFCVSTCEIEYDNLYVWCPVQDITEAYAACIRLKGSLRP